MFIIDQIAKSFLEKKIARTLSGFPQQGHSIFGLKLFFWLFSQQQRKNDIHYNLGWLHTTPHRMAVDAYKTILDQNPNNSGNWSWQKTLPTDTKKIENAVIRQVISLYRAPSTTEGYITSGGTEGNIFFVWAGITFLASFCNRKKMCILKTQLTHYSIRKAADISGVTIADILLNKASWSMDEESFYKTIHKLFLKGYRGFLIPLTLGYTLTGTSDDAKRIISVAQKLQRELPIRFFIWIDAALNGLITPFMRNAFRPFSLPFVRGIIVDFHKIGLAPYPAGIVLHQHIIRRTIAKNVDYLPFSDATVLGSRPGASALAIWGVIQFFGKRGYASLIHRCLNNKEYFLQRVKALNIQNCETLSDKQSATCSLVVPPNNNLLLPLERKYQLFPSQMAIRFSGKIKPVRHKIYKFYFLPHVTRSVVDEFLFELSQLLV